MIESLSGQQIGQLVDALLGAYPSRDDLRMMVTIELDETLEAIADGANQRVVTFNLVTWAVRSGRIDDLLAGARRGNPGNRVLAALVESWQAAAPATPSAQHPRATSSPTGPAAIDVFLSYAREDSGAMREVEASLRVAGLAVWTDEGLEAGTPSWSAAIEEAVAQAAAMVVLLSPAAKASVWVTREVALAQVHGKRIFPILVAGDERTSVSIHLIDAQWADGRQGLGPALWRVQPALLRYVGRAPVSPISFDWVEIPAGPFLMGSDKQKDGQADDYELPQHTVTLPAYRIARVPVTNEQYLIFVRATGHEAPGHWSGGRIPEGKEQHPVVDVSFADTVAFCEWASRVTATTVRLPSEAEWEKAARGTDGRIYPWDDDRPTKERCNSGNTVGETTPVEAYPKGASPYGVLDMSGNVWERTSTKWVKSYRNYQPDDSLEGDITRTVRGGSFNDDDRLVRCVCRYFSDDPYISVGFRVVSPGFVLRDYARFDTDMRRRSPHDPVTLGRVLDGGQPVGNSYVIERRDLTKHGLIVGVTGAGRTTTVFSMLDQLYRQGKGTPFLVIEPTKTEYRVLLKAGGRFPDMRIYTLGDERCAPFRLNPFAFAIGDARHRIHVQTHIEFLKAVFNAAFVLYAPLPYVLETCLHEIYTDKGWDLTTGINLRLPLAQQGNEADWPVFPTLTDLYHKVEEVTGRLGYKERIEMNVNAGLKARIGSLRLGSKGFMLDCAHSLPMADLLAHPTVLEMASIDNEDEKAFLLGLLLTALYEYHIIQQQMAAEPGNDLLHLTVLEEAHRLLKNAPTEVDTERTNTRGQAVETFTNMLSEIRSYGEGVLIAEQSPAKLAPDCIKSTNLKIVHRLLTGDDRELLAATMNMDDSQSRYFTTLLAGQAVIYVEGADSPNLLAMEKFRPRLAGVRVVDADVQQLMAPLMRSPVYTPTPDFDQHFPPELVQLLSQQDIPLSLVHNRALQLLDTADFQEGFDRYVLGIVEKPVQSAAAFDWLRRLAMQQWVDTAALRTTILYTVLVALEQHAERRGRLYRWAYHRTGNAYAPLRRALGHLALGYPYATADDAQMRQSIGQIAAQIEPDLLAFGDAYRKLTAVNAPYDACRYCQTHCRYRQEAIRAARQRYQRENFLAVLETPDDALMWQRVAGHCQDGASHMVGVSKLDMPVDAVICYALHAAQVMDLSSNTQLKLVKNVAALVKPTP